MIDWLKAHRHPVREADLSAYLDGDLPPERKRQLEEHLRSCDGCSRQIDALRSLAAALREMPESPLPRSFTLTPEQARGIQKAKPSSTAARQYPAFRTAAAVAIVLLFASVGADIFLQSGGEPTEREAVMLGAARESAATSGEGNVAADQAAEEKGVAEDYEAAPFPSTAQSIPLMAPLPQPLVTPLPGESGTPLPGLAAGAPETPPAVAIPTPPLAEEAVTAEQEEDEDSDWLRAAEGVLGGLALGFIAVAFFAGWRSRRTQDM